MVWLSTIDVSYIPTMYLLCKKDIDSSCPLLCESGDRFKVDQSLFSADLQGVMLTSSIYQV